MEQEERGKGRTRKNAHGILGVEEVAVFYKDIGTHARVDTRGRVFLKARAVDVTSPETDGRQPRVDIGPVVVVVGHVEMTSIFVTIIIRVTDQRSLWIKVDTTH